MDSDELLDELTSRLSWNMCMAKEARYCVPEAGRWIWYKIRRNQEIIQSLEIQIKGLTNAEVPRLGLN